MEFIGHFRRLTPVQRNTFVACFLGWALDAFDFFILTFCVSAIATEFQTRISAVAEAIYPHLSEIGSPGAKESGAETERSRR